MQSNLAYLKNNKIEIVEQKITITIINNCKLNAVKGKLVNWKLLE